ncbi:hypothetical protein CLOM_g2792, partial [Closterium sp. NIES-68]
LAPVFSAAARRIHASASPPMSPSFPPAFPHGEGTGRAQEQARGVAGAGLGARGGAPAAPAAIPASISTARVASTLAEAREARLSTSAAAGAGAPGGGTRIFATVASNSRQSHAVAAAGVPLYSPWGTTVNPSTVHGDTINLYADKRGGTVVHSVGGGGWGGAATMRMRVHKGMMA